MLFSTRGDLHDQGSELPIPARPVLGLILLRDLPKIPKELLEQFGVGLMSAEAIEDASAAFKKALIERALSAELGHHLGYPPGAQRPEDETSVTARVGRRF
jgi:hypothetical protein